VSDAKPILEIVIDRDARTFLARDRLTGHDQAPRPLPDGDMPWRFEVAESAAETGEFDVHVVERELAFDPAHATACSVIAVDAWITDKVFETLDDTIYVVRVVNTSTHYVAEDICVDIEIDLRCDAVLALLPDKHSLIEIQPTHQCIKCLAPRHYIDLQFVAIARGPTPGIFPVRACVTYDLVYWSRSRARTHARLELEVHDECRPRHDPCRPPRHTPPDPGDYKLAPSPPAPSDPFVGCDPENAPPEPVEPETAAEEPAPECDCEEVAAAITASEDAQTEALSPSPPSLESHEFDDQQPSDERVDERLRDAQPHEADGMKGSDTMSNDKYAKQDPHHHDHHHHPQQYKKDEGMVEKRKGCAPACSNADEMMPIQEDCRLPEGGILEFSYTFRKGFIASASKGGRCVYGKAASNGKLECRMESIDDTVLVMDVTNHSHFHLKHVRVNSIRIFQNHEEVTMLLPSGHPVAQIIPNAVYIGSLPRGESQWVALSFITRGVAPGCYSVKFNVDYDIESCTVSAGINVEITCD
jgi:hypothetical protein